MSAPEDIAPQAERPLYAPGELVDYTAQAGDTLPVLAVRFNTTVEEITRSELVHTAICHHHAAGHADENPDLLPAFLGFLL